MSLFKGESPVVGNVAVQNNSQPTARPARVFYGTAVTRAAAAAEVDADKSLAIGSMYISAGAGAANQAHIYIKLSATGTVASDWARFTTTAAE